MTKVEMMDKINRVINSCQTQKQLDTAEKYLKLWRQEWDRQFSDMFFGDVTTYCMFLSLINDRRVELLRR